MVKVARSDHKSEDFSESVNSFHSGAIFLPPLGHKTSRNAFVGSILFPGRISLIPTDSGHELSVTKNARICDVFAVSVQRSGAFALRLGCRASSGFASSGEESSARGSTSHPAR